MPPKSRRRRRAASPLVGSSAIERLEDRTLLSGTPPTVTMTGSALQYTENGAPVSIDGNLVVADAEDANFTGATVRISSGFAAGQDVLTFVNQNGISGSFDSLTGVLTLSGTSSKANYQAALRSITYNNTSENPGTQARTIQVQVSDGTGTGTGTRSLVVTRVNDLPVAANDSYTAQRGGTLQVTAGTVSTQSTQFISPVAMTGNTGEKPQSKVWEYGGTWWAVFSDSTSTKVWRLDGTVWTSVLDLSNRTSVNADVKVVGDVVHVLMRRSSATELRSIQYVSGGAGTYAFWSAQPNLVTLPSMDGLETVTMDVDSTGRMWVAYNRSDEVRVRYSDGPYTTWSSEIVLATGVSSDDISAIIAMPNGRIGVFWSNQSIERFGFRTHVDGADPNTWTATELPAASSALNIGDGFADDHMNLAVKADGTLYVAAKTGYNSGSAPRMILLVRRPNGTWDNTPYDIDSDRQGTRPIVQLSEIDGRFLYFYRNTDSNGPIVYHEITDNGTSVTIGPEIVLLDGAGVINASGINNASSSKNNFDDDLVVIASASGQLVSARLLYRYGVLANDYDVDGNTLTAVLVSGPSNGTLTLNANGTFTYTHNGGSSNSDSFTYRANDGLGNSNLATVSITIVGGPNTPPTGVADSYTLAEGGTLVANDANGTIPGTNNNGVLVNDTDPENNPLTAVLVSGPTHGTLTLNPNGTFTYTHNGSENFSDSFTYRPHDGTALGNLTTVTFTITPVNDPPVAVNDSYTVTRGGTLNANDATGSTGTTNDDSVLRNDTDAENNPLTALLVAGPSNGTLTLNANGTFTYTHNGGSSTSDSFTYRANDGSANSNIATVNITIQPAGGTQFTVSLQNGVNGYNGMVDTYLKDSSSNKNYGNDDELVAHGNPDRSALMQWDVSSIPQGSVVQSASITLFVTNTTRDEFELYEVLRTWFELDASWNEAAPGQSWGLAGAQQIGTDRANTVLGTFTSPNGGLTTLTLNAAGIALVQSWINSPSTNRGVIMQDYDNGTSDGVGFSSSEATTVANRPKLTITYTTGGGPVNSPPVANNDSYTVNQGGTLTTTDTTGATGTTNDDSVLRNDTDADNNPLTASLVTGPSNGTLTLNANGTFTYTHNGGATTADSFTYRANDGQANSNIATVNITITLTPNNPPTGVPESYTLAEGGTLIANDANGTVGGPNDNGVLANDTDPENNALTAVLVSGPTHGTLTLNPNGTFTYTHNGSENFSDSFTYRPHDGTQQGNLTTVTFTITPVNDPPVAVNDSYTVANGGTLTTTDTTGATGTTNDDSVLRNDTDAENNPLTALLVAGPSNGTLTLNANGTFTYTHNGGSSTSDSFTYRANDGSANSNIATVNITIQPAGGTQFTVSLQNGVNGYNGMVDTYFKDSSVTKNYGDDVELVAHGNSDRTALMQWDVSSIPQGSVVQSATIMLFVTNTTSSEYELYEILRTWSEMESTWNQAANGQNWGQAGAQQIGTDRANTVLGTFTSPNGGLTTLTLNAAGIALVQSWINNPSTNRGVIMQDYDNGTSDGVGFSSSEATTVANRPKLTITYLTPGALLNAESLAAAGNEPVSTLTANDLAAQVAEAERRWLEAVPAGARELVKERLSTLKFTVVDLPGTLLGQWSGNTIQIDLNAAGWGWFIDATPGDDAEFDGLLRALDGSEAANRIDLLSVVLHEMGHALGLGHDDASGIMNDTLGLGEREVPEAADLTALDRFFSIMHADAPSLLPTLFG